MLKINVRCTLHCRLRVFSLLVIALGRLVIYSTVVPLLLSARTHELLREKQRVYKQIIVRHVHKIYNVTTLKLPFNTDENFENNFLLKFLFCAINHITDWLLLKSWIYLGIICKANHAVFLIQSPDVFRLGLTFFSRY